MAKVDIMAQMVVINQAVGPRNRLNLPVSVASGSWCFCCVKSIISLSGFDWLKPAISDCTLQPYVVLYIPECKVQDDTHRHNVL